MAECKHGLKQGCFYCHGPAKTSATSEPVPKKRAKTSRLSEQMNERMANLKQRLRRLRGE